MRPPLRAFLNALPLFTLAVTVVLLASHAVRVLLPNLAPDAYACIAWPVAVSQPHRLITSVLLHVNLAHVTLNVLAVLALAPPLETAVGTVGVAALTAAVWALSEAMYLAYEAASGSRECAMGFSGVGFGLWVYHVTRFNVQHVEVYPGVSVSSRTVPWLAMALVQVAMPHVSLASHVCGALAGLLLCAAPVPSATRVDALALGPRFLPCPPPQPSPPSSDGYRLGSV